MSRDEWSLAAPKSELTDIPRAFEGEETETKAHHKITPEIHTALIRCIHKKICEKLVLS